VSRGWLKSVRQASGLNDRIGDFGAWRVARLLDALADGLTKDGYPIVLFPADERRLTRQLQRLHDRTLRRIETRSTPLSTEAGWEGLRALLHPAGRATPEQRARAIEALLVTPFGRAVKALGEGREQGAEALEALVARSVRDTGSGDLLDFVFFTQRGYIRTDMPGLEDQIRSAVRAEITSYTETMPHHSGKGETERQDRIERATAALIAYVEQAQPARRDVAAVTPPENWERAAEDHAKRRLNLRNAAPLVLAPHPAEEDSRLLAHVAFGLGHRHKALSAPELLEASIHAFELTVPPENQPPRWGGLPAAATAQPTFMEEQRKFLGLLCRWYLSAAKHAIQGTERTDVTSASTAMTVTEAATILEVLAHSRAAGDAFAARRVDGRRDEAPSLRQHISSHLRLAAEKAFFHHLAREDFWIEAIEALPALPAPVVAKNLLLPEDASWLLQLTNVFDQLGLHRWHPRLRATSESERLRRYLRREFRRQARERRWATFSALEPTLEQLPADIALLLWGTAASWKPATESNRNVPTRLRQAAVSAVAAAIEKGQGPRTKAEAAKIYGGTAAAARQTFFSLVEVMGFVDRFSRFLTGHEAKAILGQLDRLDSWKKARPTDVEDTLRRLATDR
jgi:hypothetical protein